MRDLRIGDYIIYVNGDIYELGRIKSIRDDGAFVAYHNGETGAWIFQIDKKPKGKES